MLKSMLQHLCEARAEELDGEGAGEAGFTLIELMVVLLIIAILLAIAIPTFLGVTGSANDRAAQSNLTNAVTEASAIYQNNNQSFPLNAAVATYGSSAPEFTWAAAAVSAQNNISVDASTDGQAVILGDYSSTKTCWYVLVSPNEPPSSSSLGSGLPGTAGTYYTSFGKKTGDIAPPSCNAATAAGYGSATWFTTYGAAAGAN
ncbi:MAG: type II secretion system protein [Acidimicrobiales bacterium]|jgi:type IV pilus assembly protein PilA